MYEWLLLVGRWGIEWLGKVMLFMLFGKWLFIMFRLFLSVRLLGG